MSKANEPVLYSNEQELAQLRADIGQAEHEFAAGLGEDITDIDSDEFAEQIMAEAERLHPELKDLPRERDTER
jgi:hypothetical protein